MSAALGLMKGGGANITSIKADVYEVSSAGKTELQVTSRAFTMLFHEERMKWKPTLLAGIEPVWLEEAVGE